MKNLLLHIGTHKTGTTSIQYTLANQSRVLNNQGLIYPSLYSNPKYPGHHFLANKKSGKRYNRLIDIIDNAPQKTAILSTELLSTTEPKTITDLAYRYNTKIICIVRRQDEYLESMYRELCKSSFCTNTPEEFIDSTLNNKPVLIFTDFKSLELRAPLPADYHALLCSYAELLGEDRIIGIPYDDPVFGRDAVSQFCQAVGIKMQSRTDLPRNASFSPDVVAFRRRLDSFLGDSEKLNLRPIFWRLNQQVALRQSNESIFSTAQRRRILNHYSDSNARLRARFIPTATTDWLATPDMVAQRTTTKQAAPLDEEKILDLTSRLLRIMSKQPKS